MDVLSVACFSGVAAATFAGACVALGGRVPASAAADPLGELVGTARQRIAALSAASGLTRRLAHDRRRRDVLRQLPTMIDVLTLGLAAGLSFDASLELYCEHYRTTLSEMVRETMLAWRLGAKTRGEALDELADELDVAALRRFSDAVNQALAFGSPLAGALERQAQLIRDEQRAEMEAEIERVPVRMLIPLGTLIVPAMLLAILGPLLGSSVMLA